MPRISIYIRIILFSSILVFLPVFVSSLMNYQAAKNRLEQNETLELREIVDHVAHIDGDLVSRIKIEERTGDPELLTTNLFLEVQDQLEEAIQASESPGAKYPVYVFRKALDFEISGEMEFAVMTTRDRFGNYFWGKRYAAFAEHRMAFAGETEVTGIFSDEFGTWIAAVAPVYDSQQQVVAVVQVSRSVTERYKAVRGQAWAELRRAFITLLVCILPALWMARSFVKPIRALVEATQRFANNQLEYRVRMSRRDELGDLAHNFNWMAEQLLVDRLKRVESEASLRSSESEARKLALVASRTHNSVIIMDAEGRIEWVNEGFVRMTGHTLEEVSGRRPIDFLIGAETDEKTAEFMRDQFRQGEGFNAELLSYRKDGSTFRMAVEVQPVRDDRDTIVNYVAIQADITDRWRVAAELQKAKDEAEAANSAKSEFLAVMSHEIRTPMNGILGFTNLLLGTRLNNQQRDYTETIQSSGEALLSLLNDILDFSKIESGRMDLDSQPFELRQCVEDALDLIAAPAARKGIEVVARISPDLPETFVGDLTRIRQIVVNLAGNAVKFTDEGEIIVTVEGKKVTVEGEDLWEIHCAVKDTGVGIPEERMKRLFKAFSQVDSSITRKYGGTGLGLVICRRLAELMGGKIWGTSEPGKGSTFQFTALLREADEQKLQQWVVNAAEIADRKILLLDDNATAREHLNGLFEGWGMKPTSVGTLAEAEAFLTTQPKVDLVLLDSSFITVEGANFASRHTVKEGGKGAQMIVLGAMGMEDKVKEYMGELCQSLLTKPIHQSMLFNAMIELLSDGGGHTTVGTASLIDSTLGDRVPLKILVAEDNATNQKLALLTLKQMGYRADIAGNGLEALQAVQRQAYDLILMDVQMPEMDGLKATKEIRQRESGPGSGKHRTRIVAMTANVTKRDKENCFAAGMDDYISKPVRLEVLQRALAKGQPTLVTREEETEVRRGQSIAAAEQSIRELCDALEPEGVIEMAESFLVDVPEMIATLRVTADGGELKELERAAHSLKGAAGIFNWKALAIRAKAVEDAAEAGDLQKATDHIKAVEEEVELAHAALERAILQLKESLIG
jgi:PAS domain S-box-containing protein